MCDKYWEFERENVEANYQCSNRQFYLALELLKKNNFGRSSDGKNKD